MRPRIYRPIKASEDHKAKRAIQVRRELNAGNSTNDVVWRNIQRDCARLSA